MWRLRPYQTGRPSSVVMDFPCTATAVVTQDLISTPSASTEQEPHCANPQPNLGPLRPSWSAST